MNWYQLSESHVLEKLRSSENGLTENEVQKRLSEHGKNQIPSGKKLTLLSIFLRQFKSYFTILLVGASGIAYFINHTRDAILIAFFVVLNVSFGFIQEARSERALSKLKRSLKISVRVFRDGQEKNVPLKNIVPGDVVVLEQGARVPADTRVLFSHRLQADESALTGESLPEDKYVDTIKDKKVPADQHNMLFQGTVITQGTGRGVVVETGVNTYYGQIAQKLAETKDRHTPLQVNVQQLSKFIALIVVGAAILIFAIGFLVQRDLDELLITTIAVAISAIPEGLLVAITFILTMGMMRLLKRHALVRELNAVETLGSTSVILSDKTGTLTQGKMEVEHIEQMDGKKAGAQIIENALYNNTSRIENPSDHHSSWRIIGTPTEKALFAYALDAGDAKEAKQCEKVVQDIVQFDSKYKFQAVRIKKGRVGKLLLNGAPEIVLEMCTHYLHGNRVVKLNKKSRENILGRINTLSKEGLRLVAAAYQKAPKTNPKDLYKEITKTDFIFAGLYGIKDPVRTNAKKTISYALRAGVRTVIVTGDYALTAKTVARDVGIEATDEEIITGEELEGMSDKKLRSMVKTAKIFARVNPVDKMRIAAAFQSNGHVVAMTGDGINDAPTLKAADIGVAVGAGQEIAKEAADMVLLRNNLSVIVDAIKQGRIIFDNIRKVTLYLLFGGFASVTLIAVSMLIGLPLPFTAAMILWLNFIEDGFPVYALAFEPGEKGIMKLKPRPRHYPLIDGEMKALIFGLGVAANIVLLSLFLWLWTSTHDVHYTQTMVFAALSIDTFFVIFSIKSIRRPVLRTNLLSNKKLIAALTISFAALIGAVYIPGLQLWLGTVALSFIDWVLIIALGLFSMIGVELVKWVYRRKQLAPRAH